MKVVKKSKLSKIIRMKKKIEEKETEERGEGSCSTSYPSGNQVDGLPLVAIPKQLEKGRAGAPARRYS